jgi:hypothetical protein
LIFCKDENNDEVNVDELLQQTRIIFDDLPLTLPHKKWEIVLDYLCFEYYYSIGSNKAANQYFDKVNNNFSNLLLFNHIGLVSKFLTTKISFCYEFNKLDLISETLSIDKMLLDVNDTHTLISVKVYNALVCFYQKKYKIAINYLNETLNEFVFKDYFHEYLNIKLSLVYFYIVIGEFEKAQASMKIITRRIRIENNKGYNHILYLLKSFDGEINKEGSPKNILKQRDLFTLFIANNNNKISIIKYLILDLKKKYHN